LIGYNKIYKTASIIINYIFNEKINFESLVNEGRLVIQIRVDDFKYFNII